MSYKIKSSLYFASFVLALAAYYVTSNTNRPHVYEMANANVENVRPITE